MADAPLPAELQAGDPAVRRKALLAMASQPPSPDLLDVFLQVAQSDADLGLKMLARQLFQETKANVGAQALSEEVLDTTGAFHADGLADLLGRPGETSTKLEAIRQATEHGSPETLVVFRKRLPEEDDPWIIASLLKGIGALGDSQDIHLIQPFLKNEDLRIQANAIEALELIGDELSFSLVAPMLKSRDARIRANAIKCLVRFDPDEAIATLERLAFSDAVGDRESAVYCLGIVAHPRVPQIAAEMAPQEKEPTLLRRQIRLLAEEGDRSAVGPLAYLAEVLEGEAQEQAALALGRVRGRVEMTDDEVEAARALIDVEYGSAKELVADDDVMVSRFGMSMPEGTLPQAAAAAAEQEVVSYLTKRKLKKREKPPEQSSGEAVKDFLRENPAFGALAGVTGLFLCASVAVFIMPAESAAPPPRPTQRKKIQRKKIQRNTTEKEEKDAIPNERVTLQARVTNIDRKRKTALLKHNGKILSVKLDSEPPKEIGRNTDVEVRGHFTGEVRFGAREFIAVDLRKR